MQTIAVAKASQKPFIQSSSTHLAEHARRTERLPFSVVIVTTPQDMEKAVRIRFAAYNRHVPEFATQLQSSEPYDTEDGSVVLLATSKADGEPLGTMRIQTNRFKPLNLESSLNLPDWLAGRSMAQASRLGVAQERIGRMVKIALFKGYYEFCVAAGIEWMVIAARSPLDRQYDQLLFSDVYPGMGYIPIKHAKNLEHRVMAFHVPKAEALWREKGHGLLQFMIHTEHPDIRADYPGIRSLKNPLGLANPVIPLETATA